MNTATQQFVEKANRIHGDKYLYDKTNYKNSKEKVIITCKIHGDFWQKPNSHLIGQGCSKCAVDRRKSTLSLSNEEFIAKAKAVHGDKYDYSQVNYTTYQNEVAIICPTHGVFLQKPSFHISVKSDCPKCARIITGQKIRSTTEEFINKAKLVHNNKYDYSQVDYVNSETYITIKCPEHGDFQQIPSSHLIGRGCPHCGGRLQSNTEEFIDKAVKVHGDQYDYSKSKYTTAKIPIAIICKKHGPFDQIPNNHLQGTGCPSCAARVIVDTNEFITRAKKTHGDLYDYSKSKYTDSRTLVIIGCRKHGDFEQAASEHIRGRGCDKCGGTAKLNIDEFITKAKAVHNERYDYSESIYITSQTPLKIICNKHGIFKQTPANHLSGTGCPICKSSKGELAISKILKKHNIDFTQEYRIPNQDYRFKYDFYIPLFSILIEFHGAQHYHAVDYFGGEKTFFNIKLRDSLKRTLAKGCGYKLIEIKYTLLDNLTEEAFEERLLRTLNRFKPLSS